MLKKLFNLYSSRARKKRAAIFNSYFNVDANTKILDLGGADGSFIASTVPFRENVYVADIDKDQLRKAREKYGFKTIELDESGVIPCSKNDYDIIFSNSVIEHVTVDKDDMYNFKTNASFRAAAFERQKVFANEIRSKCDKYYVQTPYKYFLVESHSWLPGIIVLLPRTMQMKVISNFNKFWAKKTTPDWHLLTVNDMKQLFPDAEIIKEKSLLFTKSLIAVKR